MFFIFTSLKLSDVYSTDRPIHTRQTVHGVQGTGADPEAAEGSVVISRSHTGKGADVVTERLPGKAPVFAGGSGYKALRVLKVGGSIGCLGVFGN